MILIVGTNHELQHDDMPSRAPPDIVQRARENLKSYLRRLAREVRPTIIAEEMSQFVLDAKGGVSHCRAVADELGIEHRLCDPDPKERQEIGLPSHGTENSEADEKRHYNRIREKYWFMKLSDALDQTIVFVCGACHVTSFARLLQDRDVAVTVQNPYVGREIYDP